MSHRGLETLRHRTDAQDRVFYSHKGAQMGLIQLGTHCVHNVSVSRTPLQVTSDKVTKCFFDLQKMTGEGEKEKQISNYNYIYLYIIYNI